MVVWRLAKGGDQILEEVSLGKMSYMIYLVALTLASIQTFFRAIHIFLVSAQPFSVRNISHDFWRVATPGLGCGQVFTVSDWPRPDKQPRLCRLYCAAGIRENDSRVIKRKRQEIYNLNCFFFFNYYLCPLTGINTWYRYSVLISRKMCDMHF